MALPKTHFRKLSYIKSRSQMIKSHYMKPVVAMQKRFRAIIKLK